MTGEGNSARLAQKRYRERQKAKFEEFKQRVDILNRKLSELDVKHAGLASQNKVLEEQVATITAKRGEAAEQGPAKDGLIWDALVGAALAEYANIVRAKTLIVELTVEDGRRLPITELMLLTKEFYRQVAEAVEADVSELERERQLARLLQAKGAMRRAMESMDVKTALATSAKLYGSNPCGPPSLSTIRQVLNGLQLSEAQKEELLDARQRLLRKHEVVQQERQQILQRMQEAMERNRGTERQGSTAHLLEEVDALEELKRSLEKEHNHTFQFHASLADALTTLQFAKLLVYNHSFGVKPWLLLQFLAATKQAQAGGSAASGPSPAAAAADGQNNPILDDCAYTATLAGNDSGLAGTSNGAGGQAAAAQEGMREGTASPSAALNGSDSGSLSSLLGELVDDKLANLSDPLDLDFGQPANGEDSLWSLVQTLAS